MPTSKIEKELIAVTKVKRKESMSDQDYYKAICTKIEGIDDDDWEGLSSKAQDWYNDAVASINKGKKIKPFPDVGAVDADGDDDDADEAPKKKKKPAADEDDDDADDGDGDDDDDEPAPKKKKKKAADDDDDDADAEEDDEPAPKKKKKKPADEDDDDDGEDDDGEDDEPAPKKKKKPADEDDDDGEDDDDEPAPKKKKKKAADDDDDDGDDDGDGDDDEKPSKSGGVKVRIKKLILANPDISVDQIVKKLGKSGEVSKVTVSNVRAEFRHTLKFLQDNKVVISKLKL